MTTVWLILCGLSSLAFLASLIWLLVLAWRESTTWGLISTFVPFGIVGFALKFWEDAKTQVILCTATFLVLVGTVIGFSMSKVNPGFGEDYGGADLWANSSGFEAMNSNTFDDAGNDFGSDSGQSTAGEIGDQEAEATEIGKIQGNGAEPGARPNESSARDELANSDAHESQSPAPGPRHQRHKVVPLEDLPKLKGERAALILKNGQRVFGVIEQVGSSKVVIRKLVGGGSILFTLNRRDIEEIRTRRWR